MGIIRCGPFLTPAIFNEKLVEVSIQQCNLPLLRVNLSGHISLRFRADKKMIEAFIRNSCLFSKLFDSSAITVKL